MTHKLSFDEWYDIALDKFNQAGFKHLPLDRDAAYQAYEDDETPEEYIQSMIDENDPE